MVASRIIRPDSAVVLFTLGFYYFKASIFPTTEILKNSLLGGRTTLFGFDSVRDKEAEARRGHGTWSEAEADL